VSRRESSSGLPGRSQCERQQELTGGLERAGEGMGRERERLERAGELGSFTGAQQGGVGGHASRESATRPAAPGARSTLFINFKFPILPQTYH